MKIYTVVWHHQVWEVSPTMFQGAWVDHPRTFFNVADQSRIGTVIILRRAGDDAAIAAIALAPGDWLEWQDQQQG